MDYDKTPRGQLYRFLSVITTLALVALLVVCIVSMQSNYGTCIEYQDTTREDSMLSVPIFSILAHGDIVYNNGPVLVEYEYLVATLAMVIATIAVDVMRRRDRIRYNRRLLESAKKTNSVGRCWVDIEPGEGSGSPKKPR